MRPYRGIPIGGKDFVYGWYAKIEEKHCIITTESRFDYEEDYNVIFKGIVEVIPETVGQSIGLKDKNGTEIYEGDRIQLENTTSQSFRRIVKFSRGAFGYLDAVSHFVKLGWPSGNERSSSHWGIIGNIHQPELMEKQ